jgi:hypothetical protein
MFQKQYEPPALEGYYFWSVFVADHATKQAILDDEGGRAFAIAETAKRFDIPVEDVRAELFQGCYTRPVWHAYVKDRHRAKIIFATEEMELMLKALISGGR